MALGFARIYRSAGWRSGFRAWQKKFRNHFTVLPGLNWVDKSHQFISQLGLEFNPYTTQIESHDALCEIFNTVSLINSICIGLCRDMWGYISANYFKQKVNKDHVGSSTMPHKVNPIDFENAEGNFGFANGMFGHMSSKLPISRFQRDLSDSTVLRNIGTACGHSYLAFISLLKGLETVDVNTSLLNEELNKHWELMAEPLQIVMKFYGYKNAYEYLKELTRGKEFSQEEYLKFVDKLEKIPEHVKERMRNLSPRTYLGNAKDMARNIQDFLK